MRTLGIATLTSALLLFMPAGFAADPAAPKTPRALPTESRAWKGDFDGMVKRRVVRVSVPYSRSLYFNDKGRERGITADFIRDFERYINQKYHKELGKRPITVYIIPTTRDELLKDVAEGLSDIAAGNLTVTEERRKLVDFWVAPDQRDMAEMVVTGPKSPAINTADDLAGKTVHVRKASSYYDPGRASRVEAVFETTPAYEFDNVDEMVWWKHCRHLDGPELPEEGLEELVVHLTPAAEGSGAADPPGGLRLVRSRHRVLSFRFDPPSVWRARVATRDGRTYAFRVVRAVYVEAGSPEALEKVPVPLFVPERLDRVEARGANRGVETGGEADGERDAGREHDRGRGHDGRPSGVGGDDPRDRDPDDRPRDPAEHADRERLDQDSPPRNTR